MDLVRTFADARSRYRGRVALVPTMGYFHEGHLALMTAARAGADTVVVSHFVNRLQFNDPADLEGYPRDLARDLALMEAQGVDLTFAPPPTEMFPMEPLTRVKVSGVGDGLEGLFRPGHFEGVATVVAKLFAGLQPQVALFGRKDAQQLAVVRRLTADLSFPLSIAGLPTVRESDGLALSSRNVLIKPEDRAAALLLSQGLFAAARLVESGETRAGRLREEFTAVAYSLDIDYVELASQDEAEPIGVLDRPSFLAAAVRVGGVRLIDNVTFDLVGGQVMADLGVRLDHPSLLYQ